MRLLVCPHELKIGGSQMNAIDLAGALRDRGHEVTLFSTPGPLTERIDRLGLRFIEAQPRGRRPSWSVIRQIGEIVRRERIDLVHTYERNFTIEAYFGANVARGVPVLCTIMTMWLSRIPNSIPLTMGTATLVEDARRTRGGKVFLMEPPVDTNDDHPGRDGSAWLAEHSLDDGLTNVLVVSRLDPDLKLEGIERSVEAMGLLAGRLPVRLVIVGGGKGAEEIARRADAVNERVGRRAVVLTGPTMDPRPAYAAADVVLGQGGSSLRAMAYAKPTIVVGQKGFCELVEPDTIDRFLQHGFHGVGDGVQSPGEMAAEMRALAARAPRLGDDDNGVLRLADEIESLITDRDRREAAGAFGREVVSGRFSLTSTAARLEEMCEEVRSDQPSRPAVWSEGGKTAAWVMAATSKAQLVKYKRRLASGH